MRITNNKKYSTQVGAQTLPTQKLKILIIA